VSVLFDMLVKRASSLVRPGGERVILGITGAPGSGKSTLAGHLTAALKATGLAAVQVPMDGFHLADVELTRLGILDRKGAIETFDASGFRVLLQRLRSDRQATVYAPSFDRAIEQPIAGAIPVIPDVGIVVTEGNYLLAPQDPWPTVRAQLDEVWYAELPDATRIGRLVSRHVRFGKAPRAAELWVSTVDQTNADVVVAWRDRADLVVDTGACQLPPLSGE